MNNLPAVDDGLEVKTPDLDVHIAHFADPVRRTSEVARFKKLLVEKPDRVRFVQADGDPNIVVWSLVSEGKTIASNKVADIAAVALALTPSTLAKLRAAPRAKAPPSRPKAKPTMTSLMAPPKPRPKPKPPRPTRTQETHPSTEDGECSSEYEGACVPTDQGDVDCTELPDSDFQSVGSDPYGLDRDGDGVACESRS